MEVLEEGLPKWIVLTSNEQEIVNVSSNCPVNCNSSLLIFRLQNPNAGVSLQPRKSKPRQSFRPDDVVHGLFGHLYLKRLWAQMSVKNREKLEIQELSLSCLALPEQMRK
mgnify:CR=1 FL=1